MRTVILPGLLLLLALPASTAQAGDFDWEGMLFARLGVQTQAGKTPSPVFRRIGASGTRQAGDTQTPLGSLWKLFVYAYAIDRALPMPDYTCRGKKQLAKEELYCCAPGQSVSRDTALAQSCGLFFEPERLHLDAQDWQRYWSAKSPQVQWLADLPNLKPARQVSVSSLLLALSSIDGNARARAESALLAVVLNGRGQDALRFLGGRYRVKTYTWNHPQRSDSVIGGAAGWLSDGSAVWFGAPGSSVKVMRDYAPQLAAVAEGASGGDAAVSRCVDVAMFARYPIERIFALSPEIKLQPGEAKDLHGYFQIGFKNGKQVRLHSDNEIRLEWSAQGRPILYARLSENEYIARVIDREGRATEKEAARALSVVARSFLYQNAIQHGECLSISDSSRTQRVSPNPASAAARNIAAFSSGLVLQGVSAQYRLDAQGKNILSWKQAVQNAKEGMSYDEILRQNFEHASLASVNGESECKPLPDAERWLKKQMPQWRKALQSEPGFAEPELEVCQLSFGNPYSDTTRNRIYARGLNDLNQRITLAHEYLHLAFSGYPSGRNENYIEQWARRLIEGEARS